MKNIVLLYIEYYKSLIQYEIRKSKSGTVQSRISGEITNADGEKEYHYWLEVGSKYHSTVVQVERVLFEALEIGQKHTHKA